MINIWTDCVIAGMKAFADVRADRQEDVRAELDRRLAAGELSQDAYNRIFGIEPDLKLEPEGE